MKEDCSLHVHGVIENNEIGLRIALHGSGEQAITMIAGVILQLSKGRDRDEFLLMLMKVLDEMDE